MGRQANRRRFLGQAALAGSALLTASSWSKVIGANSRLRLASVGVSGKGWSDMTLTANGKHVDVVAVCDIDESAERLGKAADKYPSAQRYVDWRDLFDHAGAFDAVTVSTPDHMHAPASLAAMKLGKHVYCQKPLTHTVFEARQMRLAAEKYKVVTQMGNQIHSHEAYRTATQLAHAGTIGKVKEVHSWQAGPMRWMLTDDRPAGSDPIPPHVHWDLWLGSAPNRPYKTKLYHEFNWRAWQDFGTGQLGDFACHILDPVFTSLKLTAPTSIQAEASPLNREIWHTWSKVKYVFPGTELTAGPTLNLTWYDGEGRAPKAEELGLPAATKLPNAGSALIGEKGTMIIPHVAMPKLYPEEKFATPYEKVEGVDHYVGWANACVGTGKATSNFSYSGPLTETVLLGTIALRLPGQRLQWNAADLKFAGNAAADALLTKPYRRGWQPSWV